MPLPRTHLAREGNSRFESNTFGLGLAVVQTCPLTPFTASQGSCQSRLRPLPSRQQHPEAVWVLCYFWQTREKVEGGWNPHRSQRLATKTDLLENIFLQVAPGAPAGGVLAVAGAGGAALGAVQEVIPQHVLCLRVLPGALRVPPAHAAAPGAHSNAGPWVL